MGCGASGRGQVGPAPDEPGISGEEPLLTCAQCVLDGKNKVATWWCEDCREFICNYCAWSHGNTPSTKHHYLIRADAIPKEKQKVNKPGKQSWARPAESKQAVMSTYFDARAELHYVEIENLNKWNQAEGAERVRGECLLPLCNKSCCPKRLVTQVAAIVTGCTFLPGGYIAVSDYLNEQVKLFDSKFHCNSYVTLDGCRPTDICSHGVDLYVAIEDKTKIEQLKLSLPYMCYGRKLSKTGLLKTEGYCDSIAIYRRSLVSYGLVLGITYPSSFETKRFQVHTMDFYGNTLVKIFYDNMGKTLFHGKVFVTGTPKSGEIIVSDNVGGTIQGFNTRTSEGLFKLDVQAPLGISVDNSHNIYVISNSCFYWIPRHRENAVAILKRGHRSKSTNCCYDNSTSTLAVTSTHSETVQLYKIL